MQEKTKILFLITKGNFGGAQRYVFDLATSLPMNQFEVVVGCGEGDALPNKLKAKNINVIKIPSLQRDVNPIKEFASFKAILDLIRAEKPEIIHLNSSKMGGLGSLAGRIAKVPRIIFTGHGWAFNEERNFLSKAVIALAHWLTLMMCHKTIAVSEGVRRQISRFPFASKKVIQVYNGIDEIKFLSREESREKLAPEEKDKLWIGTISELHKNKGLDFVLKAFSKIATKFPNTIFMILGGGEERKHLEKFSKKLGLENRIFLKGFVLDASTYLSAFDIFTLTSRTEAFPYAPLEAGLAKLPVIASNIGGIPEIIDDPKNGFLIPVGNTEEIAKKLEELIKNDDLRKELGQNLNKKILHEFSKEKMLEGTIRVYLEK